MESLGEKLKTAREAKGWTYDYVSHETNISSRYLEALEREDFSGFPGEPYVLGFIKNYSEFLGLEPEGLLSLYRSLRIQEQPVPVEQLLKNPSPVPKIIGIAAIALAAIGLVIGAIYFFPRLPKKAGAPPDTARKASAYTMNTDSLERRFYPGDSILVTEGTKSYKLVFSNLSDTVTITTPGDPVRLDLGQEVTVDLNSDGIAELRIIAADFVKNDSASGALLRFEQAAPLQTAAGNPPAAPQESPNAGRDAATVIFSSPNPFPFTLQAAFQGYCLFRYEILSERDRPGRNEQYYQRSEEISIPAQNGIRLGISNAQAVKLQVIGGGRTVPFETGGAGEVVAADLRWVRDDDNRYRLVLIQLD
ncbi:MAG: helix-turn-helix domain-containing protein [Treponema sp.]|nr:helix-turn-helix domain-containing protein [Treponema sp.]